MLVLTVIFLLSVSFCFAVTQLQTTLATVQELLLQHQQRIQELTQELAAAKVSDTSVLRYFVSNKAL